MAASSSVLGLTMLEASQPGPTKPAPQLPLTWPTAAVWALVSSWRQRCGRWCRWTWGEARDGGGRSSVVEGVAVVPGAAGLEADPLIEPARRLPRRPRGEIHRLGPGGLGQSQRLGRQDLADPAALVELARRLLDANKNRIGHITTGVSRRGEEHWGYGRGGRPCRRCGTRIKTAARAGGPAERVTFWCPQCQP